MQDGLLLFYYNFIWILIADLDVAWKSNSCSLSFTATQINQGSD